MESKDIQLESKSPKVPLYVSVYEELYNRIKGGEFKPGDKLPGEHSLAESMNVSRGTLRQALLLLQEDGIIINRQGKGNFITTNTSGLGGGLERVCHIPLEFSKSQCDVILEDVVYQPSTKIIEENLQLDRTKLLVVFELLFKIDEEIVGNSGIFIPYEILDEYNVSLDDKEEMKNFILNYKDNNVANSRIDIRIVEARETIAKRLNIDEGETLICFYEITYSELGIPNMYLKSYCIPRYFDFYINSRK